MPGPQPDGIRMSSYVFVIGEQQTLEMPWWWYDALMVWAGVIGVVLWLFGRQLVKPLFAIVTAAALSAIVAAVVRYFSDQMPLVYWVSGAAIVGAAIGWLLARLALASLFAIVLAISATLATLGFLGVAFPAVGEPIQEAVNEFRAVTTPDVELDEDGEPIEQPEPEPADNAEVVDAEDLPPLLEIWQDLREQLGEAWTEWWDEREGSTRWAILSAAGGAFVLGGALALVLPNLAGALATALLGVILMLWPINRLIIHLPEGVVGWIPRNGWQLAIVITLFVLLGALIQWAIFRKPAKEE